MMFRIGITWFTPGVVKDLADISSLYILVFNAISHHIASHRITIGFALKYNV